MIFSPVDCVVELAGARDRATLEEHPLIRAGQSRHPQRYQLQLELRQLAFEVDLQPLFIR